MRAVVSCPQDTQKSRHGIQRLTTVVFNSVLLGKMTYAVSAWWSYSTAADKQRLEALIHRAVRVGLYPADGPNLH